MTIMFENIVKSYGGKFIFENISGKINDGDRIGLLGINGVGKTTLVKILSGLEEYDSGKIILSPENLKIGYLNQFCDFKGEACVNEVLSGFGLADFHYNTADDKYLTKIRRALKDIGFDESYLDKKIESLSGGEKTRLSLCCLLLFNPNVLFLDEPTNHLDMDTIKWLEAFISKLNKTMVIISHDRYFLDNTVNRIFEMNKDSIKGYEGNYTAYKNQKAIEIKNIEREYEKQQRDIKHLKMIINQRMEWFSRAHDAAGQNDFLRSKAKKHVSVLRAKEKKLERLEDNKIIRPKDSSAAAFDLINKGENGGRKLPEYIIEVSGLCKSFGDRVIFKNASFNVKRGEKIALLGNNGTGKTTLIKILLGEEEIDDGRVYLNPSLKFGYFSQELENLDLNNSVIDELLNEGLSPKDARMMLASMFFRGDDVFKRIENLSMGEKCRVVFTKIMLSDIDILILDEPTNYMDIVSREKLEEVLLLFKGAVLLVSHDRYFVKSIADKIFEIDKNRIITYDGGYEYFISKKYEAAKEHQKGESLKGILDEINRLECEIAFISGRLSNPGITAEEKAELDRRFMVTAKILRELKEKVK